jgi:hypothetical protein
VDREESTADARSQVVGEAVSLRGVAANFLLRRADVPVGFR